MYNPVEKSIAQLQDGMERGETTCQELARFYLDRIAALDSGGPRLNAVIGVHPQALKIARELDAERKNGHARGPLHGIPLVIKDNFDTFDQPTTAGSAALENSRPAADAFVISKLRKAGALLLAKTNLSEFARHGLTVGSLIGQTLNPYDLTRTPGGSSGGTGAAVAANLAAAGMGSDTVNSIRSPSSACSLVGIRPTTGLLSRSGIVPCSSTQDTGGPLARTVADAALLLEVCAGADPSDPITASQTGHVPKSYAAYLRADGLRGKRIGLLRTNFGQDPQVLAVMEQDLRLLKEQGAQLVDVDIPELASGRVFRECDVQRYETRPLMDTYLASVPSCPMDNLRALVDSGKLHPTIYADLKACAGLADPLGQPEYQEKLRRIQENRVLAARLMEEQQLDALCYPHQQILVVKTSAADQAGRNGIVASILSWPAITVPGGFSHPDANAPVGIPVGVEFMGRPWSEPVLLEIAYAFEQAGCFRQPPRLPYESN